MRLPATEGNAAGQAGELTARERQVVDLVAQGLTNRQIAERLCVADGTVTTHVKHVLRKLNLGRRSQIAAFAVESRTQAGWISGPNRPGSALAAVGTDATDLAGWAQQAGARNRHGAASPEATGHSPGAQRMRGFGWRHALVAGVTAALLVGLAVSLIVVRAPRPAEPSADTASPLGVPPARDLIYSARLDGTSAGLLGEPFHGPGDVDMSAVVVRTPPGAIEVEVKRPGGSTGVVLDAMPLSRYAAEADLAFAPGSDMTFFWSVRWLYGIRDLNVLRLEIHAASESMELVMYQEGRERTPVTPEIKVPGLQSGRTFPVTVVANGEDFELLLDGASVAQFTGGRSVRPTQPELGGFGSAGTVRVLGARVFALQSPQANIPRGGTGAS